MVGTIKVGKLQAADGTSNTISIESGHKISGAAGSLAIPGSVVQTLSFAQDGNIDSASTSYVATGFVCSITPKFSTSKILWNFHGGLVSYSGSSALGYQQLHRQVNGGGYSSIYNMGRRYTNSSSYYEPHSYTFLDSPSSTNQVDYQCFFKTNGNTYYFAGDPHATDNGGIICILQEIAQ